MASTNFLEQPLNDEASVVSARRAAWWPRSVRKTWLMTTAMMAIGFAALHFLAPPSTGTVISKPFKEKPASVQDVLKHPRLMKGTNFTDLFARLPPHDSGKFASLQQVLKESPRLMTVAGTNDLLKGLPAHDGEDFLFEHIIAQSKHLFMDFLQHHGSCAPHWKTGARLSCRYKLDDAEEFNHRLSVFRNNIRNIIGYNNMAAKHDSGPDRAVFAINKFADWTWSEFQTLLSGPVAGDATDARPFFTKSKSKMDKELVAANATDARPSFTKSQAKMDKEIPSKIAKSTAQTGMPKKDVFLPGLRDVVPFSKTGRYYIINKASNRALYACKALSECSKKCCHGRTDSLGKHFGARQPPSYNSDELWEIVRDGGYYLIVNALHNQPFYTWGPGDDFIMCTSSHPMGPSFSQWAIIKQKKGFVITSTKTLMSFYASAGFNESAEVATIRFSQLDYFFWDIVPEAAWDIVPETGNLLERIGLLNTDVWISNYYHKHLYAQSFGQDELQLGVKPDTSPDWASEVWQFITVSGGEGYMIVNKQSSRYLFADVGNNLETGVGAREGGVSGLPMQSLIWEVSFDGSHFEIVNKLTRHVLQSMSWGRIGKNWRSGLGIQPQRHYLTRTNARFWPLQGAGRHMNVTSAEECQAYCDAEPTCAGVSYSTRGPLAKACFMAAFQAQLKSMGVDVVKCWSDRVNGYYVWEGHMQTTECYDFETAKAKCEEAPDCGAIAMQSNVCGGKWRVTHGGPTLVSYSNWAAYNMSVYRTISCQAGQCVTTKGNICAFPFIYRGTTYNSCTTAGNGGTFWCSTETDSSGNYIGGKWGSCQNMCLATCVTTVGNICAFPFIYKGITYNSCTTAGNGGTFWCSTQTDSSGNYISGKWGSCQNVCLATTTTTTTAAAIAQVFYTRINDGQCKFGNDWGHNGLNLCASGCSSAYDPSECATKVRQHAGTCNQNMFVYQHQHQRWRRHDSPAPAPAPDVSVGCYCFSDLAVTESDCTLFPSTGYMTYTLLQELWHSYQKPLTYTSTPGACRIEGDLTSGVDEVQVCGDEISRPHCMRLCDGKPQCSGFVYSNNNTCCSTFTTVQPVWGTIKLPQYDCYVNERNQPQTRLNYTKTLGACRMEGDLSRRVDETQHGYGNKGSLGEYLLWTWVNCQITCDRIPKCSGFMVHKIASSCITFTTVEPVWGTISQPDWDCYVNQRSQAPVLTPLTYTRTLGECKIHGDFSRAVTWTKICSGEQFCWRQTCRTKEFCQEACDKNPKCTGFSLQIYDIDHGGSCCFPLTNVEPVWGTPPPSDSYYECYVNYRNQAHKSTTTVTTTMFAAHAHDYLWSIVPVNSGRVWDGTYNINWKLDAPESVFRTRDQSGGTCYAYTAASTIRQQAWINMGKDPGALSVQYIMDCLGIRNPCNGGNSADVCDAAVRRGGFATVKDYGGQTGGCHKSKCKAGIPQAVTLSGESEINGEASMAHTVVTRGPMMMMVAANAWSSYSSGIMPASMCWGGVNHGVSAVGIENSKNWILRNSWGSSWGEGGYIRLQYGENACRIGNGGYYANNVRAGAGCTGNVPC